MATLDSISTQYLIDIEGSERDIEEYFYQNGWTDGLPIVAPIPERVQEMLNHTDLEADTFVGEVPPKRVKATVFHLAVHAVMAGCKPKYFPVVITAVKALLQESFNFYGIQATTNPVAPLILVNGPIAEEIGINTGHNCFGQGAASNATIGRAVRLACVNLGAANPGEGDKATAGQPAKYTFCSGENEPENLWESLRSELGFEAEVSTVTVFGAVCMLNVLDLWSRTGQGVLTAVANAMSYYASNDVMLRGQPLVVLSPEHAKLVYDSGFTKDEVRQYLFETAQIPSSTIAPEMLEALKRVRPKMFANGAADTRITVADDWRDIMIVVAGGTGPHSQYVPSFGDTRSVTLPITDSRGVPLKSVSKQF
jgi:hypothetical protein